MGLIRKVASISTAGMIDFKSDKERIASSSRKGASAAKKQNKLIKEQNDLLAAQAAAQQQAAIAAQQAAPVMPAPGAPVAMPAGWYPDPQTPGMNRYWDGLAWTATTAPATP